MEQKRSILLPALIVPTLLAFSSRADELGFHPGKGATVTKSFSNTTELTLDEMAVSRNGEEIDPSMIGMELSLTTEQNITVVDEYGGIEGDRPVTLTRRYDELESTTSQTMSNAMLGETDMDLTSSSELEGLTVVFAWNEESGEFDTEFEEDSGGDEALLEGLVEDMDLRLFLPPSEVSKEDTWEIDPEAIRHLLAPGGALKLVPENLEDVPGIGGSGPRPTADQFLGDMEGKVEAEYLGTRDEDGVKVAAVKLTFKVSSAKDLTELMKGLMEDADLGGGEDMGMTVEAFDSEFQFEGEGELLWNIEAGLVHSLEVSGDVTQLTDTMMNMSAMGEEWLIEMSMNMVGSMTIEVTTGSEG